MPRPDRQTSQAAFTLVEAAVAIAIVAILAGALTPLVLQTLNQQREIKTRESLKAAFEGMFGSRDRRIANMHADFGFAPGVSLLDLRAMVLPASAGTGLPNYGYNGRAFFWGWNGPYWSGPTDAQGRPQDGWGRPMDLVVTPAGGQTYWQVRSPGRDGTLGTPDDLRYPTQRASVISFNATLVVLVTKSSGATYAGNCTLTFLNGTGTPTTSPAQAISNSAGTQSFTFNENAGGMELHLTPTTGTFTPIVLALDLMPGETRQVEVTI